jgi:DNA-binding MarR family transcriptional regulator
VSQPPVATGGVPLARLFAMALRDFVTGLHERLAARGYPEARSSHGFVLLSARGGGITMVDVAELLGVTKQAASKTVEGLCAAGYLRRVPHPSDGRARLLVVSERGAAFLAAVEDIYAELEAEWAGLLGRDRVEALRGDLEVALRARHGGPLPQLRPT